MPANTHEWSAFDKKAMRYFKDLREEDLTTNSYRFMAAKMDMGHNRIRDLIKQIHGVPTLSEFIKFCMFFKKDPAKTLDTLLKNLMTKTNQKIDGLLCSFAMSLMLTLC